MYQTGGVGPDGRILGDSQIVIAAHSHTVLVLQ